MFKFGAVMIILRKNTKIENTKFVPHNDRLFGGFRHCFIKIQENSHGNEYTQRGEKVYSNKHFR